MSIKRKIIIAIYYIIILFASILLWGRIEYSLFPNNINDIFFSILYAISFSLMGFSIVIFFYKRFDWAKRNVEQYQNDFKNFKLLNHLAIIILPIIEEIFFRGLILSYFGFWISVVLFGLPHAIFFRKEAVSTFITVFLWGIIFNTLLLITSSLLAPIICHILIVYYRIIFVKTSTE